MIWWLGVAAGRRSRAHSRQPSVAWRADPSVDRYWSAVSLNEPRFKITGMGLQIDPHSLRAWISCITQDGESLLLETDRVELQELCQEIQRQLNIRPLPAQRCGRDSDPQTRIGLSSVRRMERRRLRRAGGRRCCRTHPEGTHGARGDALELDT